MHGPPNVQLMLLGNKCDLRAEIQDGGTSVDYLTAKVSNCFTILIAVGLNKSIHCRSLLTR